MIIRFHVLGGWRIRETGHLHGWSAAFLFLEAFAAAAIVTLSLLAAHLVDHPLVLRVSVR